MNHQIHQTPDRLNTRNSAIQQPSIIRSSQPNFPITQNIIQNTNQSQINSPVKRQTHYIQQQQQQNQQKQPIIVNRPSNFHPSQQQNQQQFIQQNSQNRPQNIAIPQSQLPKNSQIYNQNQQQQQQKQNQNQVVLTPQRLRSTSKNQQVQQNTQQVQYSQPQQPTKQSQFPPQNIQQLKNSQFPQFQNQKPIQFINSNNNNNQQTPLRVSQYHPNTNNNNTQIPQLYIPPGQPFQYIQQQPKIHENVYNPTNFSTLQQMLSVQNELETIKSDIKGPLLPPKTCDKEYTLVLDLDETLIHTYDLNEEKVDFYIRPFCREFLKNASEHFEIVTFTAALKDYADVVIDNLDTDKVISHRLYRHQTRAVDGKIKKDLSIIGRPIHTVMIVDNLEQNFSLQKENGYYIPDFTNDSTDKHLQDLNILLKIMVSLKAKDIRTVLKDKDKLINNYKKNPFMFQLFAQDQYNDYYSKGMINDDKKQYVTPEDHYKQQQQIYQQQQQQQFQNDQPQNLQNDQQQLLKQATKSNLFIEDQSPVKKPYQMNIVASGGIENSKIVNLKQLNKQEGDIPKQAFSPTKKLKEQQNQSNQIQLNQVQQQQEEESVLGKIGKAIFGKFFGGRDDENNNNNQQQNLQQQQQKNSNQLKQNNKQQQQQFSVNFFTKSTNISNNKSQQEKTSQKDQQQYQQSSSLQSSNNQQFNQTNNNNSNNNKNNSNDNINQNIYNNNIQQQKGNTKNSYISNNSNQTNSNINSLQNIDKNNSNIYARPSLDDYISNKKKENCESFQETNSFIPDNKQSFVISKEKITNTQFDNNNDTNNQNNNDQNLPNQQDYQQKNYYFAGNTNESNQYQYDKQQKLDTPDKKQIFNNSISSPINKLSTIYNKLNSLNNETSQSQINNNNNTQINLQDSVNQDQEQEENIKNSYQSKEYKSPNQILENQQNINNYNFSKKESNYSQNSQQQQNQNLGYTKYESKYGTTNNNIIQNNVNFNINHLQSNRNSPQKKYSQQKEYLNNDLPTQQQQNNNYNLLNLSQNKNNNNYNFDFSNNSFKK